MWPLRLRGGGKALMAEPLKTRKFFTAALSRSPKSKKNTSIVCNLKRVDTLNIKDMGKKYPIRSEV